jgi:hypothetical protein
MKLWVRTLVYKEILTGITINWCKELRIFRTVEEELVALKESGHSLLIGSIFGRLEITDSIGNHGLYPQDDKWERWRDHSLLVIKALLDCGIEFEIIGNKEDLEYLQRVSPPLYDRVLEHIVWKGKKYGSK